MWHRRKRSGRIACVLLAGCVALPAMAREASTTASASEALDCAALDEQETPSSAEAWFVRSRWASHCYVFQASAVRIGVDGVRTLALSHDIEDGVEREVARFLDGPPAVHERRGGAARLGGLGGEGGPERLGAGTRHLEDFYRLRLAGESRIASRHAVRLEIEPLDDQRYGRHLWLDATTALPLKQVLLDERGRAVETFQITELRNPRLYQGGSNGCHGTSTRTSAPGVLAGCLTVSRCRLPGHPRVRAPVWSNGSTAMGLPLSACSSRSCPAEAAQARRASPWRIPCSRAA